MKGWTVRTEVVKNKAEGLAKREFYLTDKDHSNHKNTSAIIELLGSEKTVEHIANFVYRYNKCKTLNQEKGRKVESFAVEFTLNLPKIYSPTLKQWTLIVEHCLADIANACNIEKKELINISRAVLHQQEKKGDHIHLLVGKVTVDNIYLRNLQRKCVTNAVKESFNMATKKYCGIDWVYYRDFILTKQKYRNRKTVPSWKIKAKHAYEVIDEKYHQTIKLRENIKNEKEKIIILSKLINKFMAQANKLLRAYDEKNDFQVYRQYHHLNKTIDDLNNCLEEIPKTSPRLMKAVSQSVNEIKLRIDSKCDKPLNELKNYHLRK
ncbi:hypothetical protein [Photobacterium leiognathi]|nr:hypothetical protein [Photobacterium leiognathi]